LPEFEALGVAVIGMSVDSLRAQQLFTAKYGFVFPLVSDAGRTIVAAYGVQKEGGTAARRVTVVIARGGTVALTYDNVKAAGHAAAVLADVREARAAGTL
jgi:peroxiredoxin Q/BCP